MKFPLKASIAALALIVATPALAATVVVDGQVYNEGDTITIDFTGNMDEVPGSPDPGLTASLDLTFDGIDGNNYLFSYDLDNTSSAPIDDSIVTVLGFSTDSDDLNLGNSLVDGTFTAIDEGNMTQGFNVQICFTGASGNNCSSGDPQEGAFQDGANALGTITLAFDSSLDSIVLSNFAVRYQGIQSAELGVNDGSGVGGGNPPPPIPEPATWAMMLMGFGATGYAIRRRRKPVLAQLA